MIFRKILNHLVSNHLDPSGKVAFNTFLDVYNFNPFCKKAALCVVFPMESTIYPCGFADKLKGAVSVYAYAKAHGLPFYISHNSPFKFDDYFEPGIVDWNSVNEVSNSFFSTQRIYVIDNSADKTKILQVPRKQVHIYTNVNLLDILNKEYNAAYKFSTLFNELFILKQPLQDVLSQYVEQIGGEYVTVSFRFLNLLGDFEDVLGTELNEADKVSLVAKCHEFIRFVRSKNPQSAKVVVTADSIRFLNTVADMDYVYVIPGRIGHSGTSSDSDAMIKTLLDFYIIRNSYHSYLGKSDGMYSSQFSRIAALTNDVPFEMIEF